MLGMYLVTSTIQLLHAYITFMESLSSLFFVYIMFILHLIGHIEIIFGYFIKINQDNFWLFYNYSYICS